MYTIENKLLKVGVKPKGAELCSIISIKNQKEFLWQADPKVWGSHAPNLFPVIGAMKNDSYVYEGKTYPMAKHGFVRRNDDFKIIDHSEHYISYQLKSNKKLYEMYPFLFEFEISYRLENNVLTVNHQIKNIDSKTMYFSVGGHPAFNCPLNKNESYQDYYLEFEQNETSESYKLNLDNGLVTDKTRTVFTDGNKIKLTIDLFNEDALIFKDLKSRKVSLKHQEHGTVLVVKFEDFPYLGIWAKPNAPYVCIEPWIGIADLETTNQNIKDKEGVITLNANSIFNVDYRIEIDQSHLG